MMTIAAGILDTKLHELVIAVITLEIEGKYFCGCLGLRVSSIYGINMALCIKLIDFLMEKHKVLVNRKNEKVVEIKAFISSL